MHTVALTHMLKVNIKRPMLLCFSSSTGLTSCQKNFMYHEMIECHSHLRPSEMISSGRARSSDFLKMEQILKSQCLSAICRKSFSATWYAETITSLINQEGYKDKIYYLSLACLYINAEYFFLVFLLERQIY